jgi:hypothetical protein
MQCPVSCSFAGLWSLHIHNGTFDFNGRLMQLVTDMPRTCSTFRFSNTKVFFHKSAFRFDKDHGSLQNMFVASGRNCTLALEDCELTTTFNSWSATYLVVCHVKEGAKV